MGRHPLHRGWQKTLAAENHSNVCISAALPFVDASSLGGSLMQVAAGIALLMTSFAAMRTIAARALVVDPIPEKKRVCHRRCRRRRAAAAMAAAPTVQRLPIAAAPTAQWLLRLRQSWSLLPPSRCQRCFLAAVS